MKNAKHAGAKQRGQARLPDPELISVEFQFLIEGLSGRIDRVIQKSHGWEGGLAPAGESYKSWKDQDSSLDGLDVDATAE
jgi:hypothetical protein